jgi:hypothetical protein
VTARWRRALRASRSRAGWLADPTPLCRFKAGCSERPRRLSDLNFCKCPRADLGKVAGATLRLARFYKTREEACAYPSGPHSPYQLFLKRAASSGRVSGESRNPAAAWTPAFAGVTNGAMPGTLLQAEAITLSVALPTALHLAQRRDTERSFGFRIRR